MKKKLPLLNALLQYSKEDNTIFSMPGNKCGKAFLRDDIGKEFRDNMGNLDITEVEPLDNLHHPEGVIKEAQEHLANLYKVKKAFFLVNGSTSGNLAAIFSAFKEGDEILVERNCHKSIYNAIILRKLKVTYIEPWIFEKGGLFLPPNESNIYEAYEKAKNPKGIILTYPNYYGICYDIEDIIIKLKEKGLKVIIDEAHGAHFGINSKLPKNMAAIADYTVVSAHKTLPALTGGSYLLVNDDSRDIEFYVNSFMTTSPSYLIMASLDYSRYYLEMYGKVDYDKLILDSEDKKKVINSFNKVKVLSEEDLPKGYTIDKSRYVLVLKNGYSGEKLQEYLKTKGIQCEMSFYGGVVLILSPSNWDEGIEKLIDAIKNLELESIKMNQQIENVIIDNHDKALEPFEVFKFEEEECELEKSTGKILKDNIIPYPPGIPIVSSGEIIKKDHIKKIKALMDSGIKIHGINNNKIKIVKIE